MKKLLVALGLLLFTVPAGAQCINVGGVNNVPQPGIVCLNEPAIPSYAATGVGIIPAAAATDIACLTGSATRTVRLQQIRISGSGTAISVPVLIRKNASANSGGTLGTGVILPVPYRLVSTDAAPTATTQSWTANPTVNDAAPGIIDNANLALAATTTSTAPPFVQFNYMNRNVVEAPTLQGIAQQLCVNLNGTTPTALLNVSFWWTEASP